jgi:hypothetical protein
MFAAAATAALCKEVLLLIRGLSCGSIMLVVAGTAIAF